MADPDPDYVDHPLLAPGIIEDRAYQTRLIDASTDEHTLVCLPTGLGKTTVSLRVTADRLNEDIGAERRSAEQASGDQPRAGAKSLLLAPTKPLVEQHADFYRLALEIPDDEIVVFTGETRPDDRADLWTDARVVIATPQVVENDLVGGRISLRDVVHCTFDECHRATGDYAYTYIAERYHTDAANPLVTGMSASPGGDREGILTVCENLGITNVEVATEDDPDVQPYTYDTEVTWEHVTLPDEIIEIRDALNEVIEDRLGHLKELGITRKTSPDLSQKDLNRMRAELRQLIDNDQSEGYEGMSVHAEIMKLRRAVELVETQSVDSVRRYFERQRNAARSSGASKASQRLVSEPKVKQAMRKAEDFDDLHPKFRKARILLAETLGINDGERVIVFTESRDTAESLTEFLGNHFDTRRFVGQGDKDGSDGMTQTEQREVLDGFRNGDFEVLVSTSVAEEGLDVPEVDLVLFFEPVPTAIRSVQRKGRTGRQTEGKVIVLMAEDTRDEAFFWISKRREQEMEDELAELKEVANELEDVLGGKFQSRDPDAGNGDVPTVTDGNGDGPGDDEDRDETEDRDEIGNGSGNGDSPRGNHDGRTQGGDGQVGLTDFASPPTKQDDVDGGDDATRNEDMTEAKSPDETGASSSDEPGANNPDEPGVVARAESADGETVEVVIDQRELDSHIARDLSMRDGVETSLETLAIGDYVVSDRVAVERKTLADFMDTLLGEERSLFEQAKDLTRHYPRPVLLLEGDGDLYTERNVHPNVVRGALASIAVDWGISVLRTRDEQDTADMLLTLATREQLESDREVSAHGEKQTKTLDEQQEYVISSIADVGPVTARSLLSHFGSVEAVLTAEADELMAATGVGEVTASRIREVVASDYAPT